MADLPPPPNNKSENSWKSWLGRIAALVATGAVSAKVASAYTRKHMSDQYREHMNKKANYVIGQDMDYLNAHRRKVNAVLGRPSRGSSLRGRGAYTFGDFGRDVSGGVGSALGGAAGFAAGGPLGGAVGASVGTGLGMEIGNTIFGRGAYSVARNTIAKAGTVLSEGTEVPSFIDSNRFTRITHREFVQDIVVPVAPTTFTNNTFVINPGNSTLFPWLASIASCYQQYEIMGMVFMFKSTSTDFSTSGALGSVILSTNYDVLESPFASKVIMENSQYAVSAKPSLSQLHAVECDPKLTTTNVKYIRNPSSSTTTSQDSRFYDHGLFQLATVGLSATAGTTLGELWVTYDIKLLKPEIVNSAFLLQGEKIGASGVSKTALFGTSQSYLGAGYATANSNTLTFQKPGTYYLVLDMAGTVTVDTAETTTLGTFTQISSTNTGTFIVNQYVVNCTAVGQVITFDATGSATVSGSVVHIASYANAS